MSAEKVVNNDFELESVPISERKSMLSITMVWTGFVFVITSMMAGGGLAAGLTFGQIIIVTIIGDIFLSAIAVAISYIACKTGLTFALLSRYSFGEKGSRITSIFIPVVNTGWYTIQAAAYGHFIAQIFHFNNVGECITMMLSAIIMGIFALIGMEALTILGFVAIPAIIFLSIATAMKSAGNVGGMHAIFSIVPKSPISISAALTIVIGTWIFSASTCIADFMRYAKNVKQAAISATLGLVVGNTLLITCGAIAAYSAKAVSGDLTAVLLSLGLIIPSLILMTTNIFTTNGGNLYSTSLNLSNTLRTSRKKAVIGILIISSLLTLTKPYQIDSIFAFLNILGNVVPPLPGIIIADFYILHKKKYGPINEINEWNIWAWVTWSTSIAFVFILQYKFNFGFPPINGIVIGFALYLILMKLFGVKFKTGKSNVGRS